MLFLAVALTTGAFAGDPQIRSGDLPGLTVKATSTYEGKALYGYIDGGADLYREYGFVRLTVQTLSLQGEEFTAETYRMSDDTAAYGIYSVSVSRNQHVLGPYSAATAYQTLFAAGCWFVRVVNYSGTERSGARTLEIASAIYRRSDTSSFRIPEVLRRVPELASQTRYVRGPLGVQNSAPEWGEALEGLEPYSGFLASARGDSLRVVLIRFARIVDATEFVRRLGNAARQATDRASEVLVVEAPDDLRRTLLQGW